MYTVYYLSHLKFFIALVLHCNTVNFLLVLRFFLLYSFTCLFSTYTSVFCAWMFSVRHVIARHVWHYPCTEPLNKMLF